MQFVFLLRDVLCTTRPLRARRPEVGYWPPLAAKGPIVISKESPGAGTPGLTRRALGSWGKGARRGHTLVAREGRKVQKGTTHHLVVGLSLHGNLDAGLGRFIFRSMEGYVLEYSRIDGNAPGGELRTRYIAIAESRERAFAAAGGHWAIRNAVLDWGACAGAGENSWASAIMRPPL